MHGGDPLTTNNRMELMAAIQALETLPRPTGNLSTTARYLLNGIDEEWIDGWQRNARKTAARKRSRRRPRRPSRRWKPHEVSWEW